MKTVRTIALAAIVIAAGAAAAPVMAATPSYKAVKPQPVVHVPLPIRKFPLNPTSVN